MDADDVRKLPNAASYVAGREEFFYPHAGDPTPPPGAKVDLLTIGHVCTQGVWNDTFLGWAPLPRRNPAKEAVHGHPKEHYLQPAGTKRAEA